MLSSNTRTDAAGWVERNVSIKGIAEIGSDGGRADLGYCRSAHLGG
jgi:hypothetical protein